MDSDGSWSKLLQCFYFLTVHVYARAVLQRPEEVIGSPGAGVNSWLMRWQLNSDPLKGQETSPAFSSRGRQVSSQVPGFSCCCDKKCTDRSNIRVKGFTLAPVRGGQSWRQELETSDVHSQEAE